MNRSLISAVVSTLKSVTVNGKAIPVSVERVTQGASTPFITVTPVTSQYSRGVGNMRFEVSTIDVAYYHDSVGNRESMAQRLALLLEYITAPGETIPYRTYNLSTTDSSEAIHIVFTVRVPFRWTPDTTILMAQETGAGRLK